MSQPEEVEVIGVERGDGGSPGRRQRRSSTAEGEVWCAERRDDADHRRERDRHRGREEGSSRGRSPARSMER